MSCRGIIGGKLLSVEEQAIRKEFQHRGLGVLSLYDVLQAEEGVQAAALVTRSSTAVRLLGNGFGTVSPDLAAIEPLHHRKHNQLVRHLTAVYAKHVGATPRHAPYVHDYYEDGLYGDPDPAVQLGCLPEVTNYPRNGVIAVALDRLPGV